MRKKRRQETIAIALRKKGYTYSEILNKVPVAKSTLSLWLRSVGLVEAQKQRITKKRIDAAQRGAESRRAMRIAHMQKIIRAARAEIGAVTRRELWLMGTMLYWAEGSKEKEYRVGVGVRFTNSDPNMIRLFLRWLRDIARISREDIQFEIYIHQDRTSQLLDVRTYWSDVTGYALKDFQAVYFKKHVGKTMRRNVGRAYYGVVRVKVKASSRLNRTIAGWIEGICTYCGVV